MFGVPTRLILLAVGLVLVSAAFFLNMLAPLRNASISAEERVAISRVHPTPASQSAFDCKAHGRLGETLVVKAWNQIKEDQTLPIRLEYERTAINSLPYCPELSTLLEEPLVVSLHSPSFEITPSETFSTDIGTSPPVNTTWLVTPKGPGSHSLVLQVDGTIYGLDSTEASRAYPNWQPVVMDGRTIEIPVEVFTKLGMQNQTETIIRIVLSICGFILTLPFLAALLGFKKD
ncbi:hypothetical protein MUY35_03005 [Aliiroseovarius sp. S1339]|uniref:hypothetical protein n=1 Tax=Aliiroseovarius sp. S1339 TaxID=2936990 RepID=UPI0020C0AA08|nr:hypothetical protein [Aliiroseovarius sp. S1339]MCK8462815.1 hypothetical protein [Aliiroseovarius sp. S1339]